MPGMRTNDLLAELEDLGIGDVAEDFVGYETAVPGISDDDAEAYSVEFSEEDAEEDDLEPVDERTYRIMALTDLVVEEFDRMIKGLSTVREAVKALKEEMASSGKVMVEDPGESGPRFSEPGLSFSDAFPQANPNAMGDIEIAIPPSIPLPEED